MNYTFQIRKLLKKCYLTGSMAFKVADINSDWDYICDLKTYYQIKKLVDKQGITVIKHPSNYSNNTLLNTFDFKFEIKGIIINLLVYDNPVNMMAVIKTTQFLKDMCEISEIFKSKMMDKVFRYNIFEAVLFSHIGRRINEL